MAVEGLPHPDESDLSWLKAGSRGSGARLVAMVVLWLVVTVLALLFIVLVVRQVHGGVDDLGSFQAELLEFREPWSDKLSSDLDGYRGWLERYGTGAELDVFNDVSAVILRGVLAVSSSPSESLFSSVYVSAHSGAIRALFLLLASLRLWLAVLLLAAYFGYNYYKPYRGGDLLGQTGNGRLFYSGARAGLENLSDTGAPDVLVRGLACPDFASRAETVSSDIWKVLSQFGATNGTNEALTAILVKHGNVAAYVPRPEDEAAFQRVFAGATLAEHVPHLLSSALTLHAAYSSGDTKSPPTEAVALKSLNNASSLDYSRAVLGALHQVHSPRLRETLGQLSPQEVATFVLSLESGKVIAHSLEGGKWFRCSNFPHLSARAILHSVLSYPQEYGFNERSRIRQALVYASRASSFAPVRMPVSMTDDIWALRQWGEVLLAAPHEISDAVDEIELVGLVRHAHQRWELEVLPKAQAIVPELTSTSFSTISDLLFLPLGSIVALLRRAVDPNDLSRIAKLSAIVGAKQQQRIERSQQSEEGGGTTLIYDRVFPPIPDAEVKSLAEIHSLQPGDLQEWSALRNILASFGWLARRVGDYTVPESSVIFSVFKAPPGYPGANALNLVGKTGLVPLRGSKFREVWGPDWNRRFQCFQRATMSESREDFAKVLQGIKEQEVDDLTVERPVGA